MLKKDQLGEIIQGPCLEAKGGWKGSVEESSNACKKGIETRLDLDEGSSQGEWNVSYILKQSYCSELNQELENLRKLVKELEIELRGWRSRRDHEGSFDDPEYTRGGIVESSHYSGSRWSRDRSHETMGRCHDAPHQDRRGHQNAALDTMSQMLRRATRSPFSGKIKHTKMLRHFNHPPFTCYDAKTNMLEHVSHYIQMISLYSPNNWLMCKVFSSSLKPKTMRWFNGLRKYFIHSFGELIQAFGARFITCSRVPQLIDALLSMRMGTGETL